LPQDSAAARHAARSEAIRLLDADELPPLAQARQRWATMVEQARASGDRPLLVESLTWLTTTYIGAPPAAGQPEAIEQARATAVMLQDPGCLAHCELAEAIGDALSERWVDAVAKLRRTVPQLAFCRRPERAEIRVHDLLGYVYAVLMMHDEALQAAERVQQLALSIDSSSYLRRGLALAIEVRHHRAEDRHVAVLRHPADDPDHLAVINEGRQFLVDHAGSSVHMEGAVWMCVAVSLFLTGRQRELEDMLGAGVPGVIEKRAHNDPNLHGILMLLSGRPEEVIAAAGSAASAADLRRDARLGFWSNLALAHELCGDHRSALGALREWVEASLQRQAVSAKAQAALFALELQAERDKLDAQRALVHAGRLVAVGQLASSVVHEVSQPAAALQLLCEEAEQHLQAQCWDELKVCLTESRKQVDRLSRLLMRMKRLSRDDPVQIQDLLATALVDEALRLTRPGLAAAGVSVERSLMPLRVRADSERVMLALVNLINNAVDAMRGQAEPSPLLKIVADVHPHDAGMACISIFDNGPGLSAQAQQQVMRSFYTTKANGLGLGLTITREALASMGGRLEVGAAEPRGARFSVCLPS
jgi:signal transduction histidine kinase